ncbi:MAG: hypothetical protein HY363_04465 [Candidatus Aenigmarchaeota archaeon]|nr:hypothetical protein [Candidatus Aenigmarchaeota archaeon]
MKKAQGLPISTVILATLGLVVLVVLFAITTGRLAIFSKEVQKCAFNACITRQQCQDAGGFPLPGQWLDANEVPCKGSSGPSEKVCCSATRTN